MQSFGKDGNSVGFECSLADKHEQKLVRPFDMIKKMFCSFVQNFFFKVERTNEQNNFFKSCRVAEEVFVRVCWSTLGGNKIEFRIRQVHISSTGYYRLSIRLLCNSLPNGNVSFLLHWLAHRYIKEFAPKANTY